jgi:PEP-CTERM motif
MRTTKTLTLAAVLVASGAVSAVETTTLTAVTLAPLPPIVIGTSMGNLAPLEYIVTSTSPLGTFAAFCLEPLQHYFGNTPPGTAVFERSVFSSTVANELSKLFTGANWRSWNPNSDGIDGVPAIDRTALGAAVWDVMVDGTFDLSAGNFRITGVDSNSQSAVSFANTAYAAGTTAWAGNLMLLQNDQWQDMVIAVPEPSTYALLFAGLASVLFVSRRRRQQSN